MNSREIDAGEPGKQRPKRQLLGVLLLAAALCAPGPAAADRTLRCGASLIEIGDNQETVVSKNNSVAL